jgi:hypothetical protein
VAGVVGVPIFLGTLLLASPSSASSHSSFLSSLEKPSQIASTVPANGDVNPYGVAVVRSSVGKLTRGDTLVSNFNSKANVQGTGTTLVQVSPSGATSLFASVSPLPAPMTCPGGIGLTTALSILPGGWVVVGSLPTSSGGSLPSQNPAGCLIVLNSSGTPVAVWSNPDINGPWDMTWAPTSTGAALFLANTLSRPLIVTPTPPTGLCTVVRLDITLPTGGTPELTSSTVIGSGFAWRANKAALILGPTGVALRSNGTLYVNETPINRISAIPQALTRATPVQAGSHVFAEGGELNAPLGMTVLPNGDLAVVNGNNGNAVEFGPSGKRVATVTLAKHGAGDLFGLEPTANGRGLLFVNDGTNALDLARVK